MVSCTTTKSFIQIFCIFLFVSQTHQNRKYDIEEEALKLFKEDYGTVLMRFRRSPEYVKILEDKSQEFDIYLSDVKNQISNFYLVQLEKKIAEMLGINPDKSDNEDDNRRSLRAGTNRRTDPLDPNNVTTVERLDSYSKLTSTMNLAQRNSMRDLGFQYAGHVIHSLIKNMGPDRVEGKSTMAGGVSTTEHVSIHSVALTEADETAPPTPEDVPPKKEDAEGGGDEAQKRFHKKRSSP